MTAYELADAIEDWETGANYTVSIKAAQMLRQQADRIAELEKEVKRLIGAEPITYGMLTFCKNCGQQDPYSPQTKPLSDEEIIAVFESPFHPKATGKIDDEVIAFARAIEERHGIK